MRVRSEEKKGLGIAMKGLRYLFLTTIKNTIKDLKNNPGKLVLVILFVALLAVTVVSSLGVKGLEGHDYRPVEEIYALVFLLYAVTFVVMSYKGLSSGASFYSMADVNLLFQTPISPKKILFYGLVKQMGTSLLIGGLLLFQYGWVGQTYPITMLDMLVILLGFGVVMFCAQITAMAIYSFTSGDDGKKRTVKIVLIGICLLMAAYVGIPLIADQSNLLDRAVKSVNSVYLNLVPVIGWVKQAVVGTLTGGYLYLVAGLLATAAYAAVILLLIVKSRSNYYEDVLQATEVSFSAITAKKEGKVNDLMPKNIKVGKTGIRKGWGANAFFYKHLLENRRSRVLILDGLSLLFLAIVVAFSYFMKDAGILSVFFMATYMQVFTTAMGRWGRELTLPYVYMVPQSPFKKLVCVCGESVLKAVFEAAVMFVLVGVILQASPVEVIACIIARTGFALLFIAGDILIERMIGASLGKVFLMFLYFIAVVILCLPGIILGAMLSTVITVLSSTAVILLFSFICNLAIAGLIAFLCRDILNYAEINNR